MVSRGQLWWVELPEPIGSERGFKRPVLIIQADTFNKSRISTLVVVVVTSNMHLADAPGNVKLPKSKSGLSKESVANVSQIITIDKEFLSQQISKLDSLTMQQVEDGVKLVLGL